VNDPAHGAKNRAESRSSQQKDYYECPQNFLHKLFSLLME